MVPLMCLMSCVVGLELNRKGWGVVNELIHIQSAFNYLLSSERWPLCHPTSSIILQESYFIYSSRNIWRFDRQTPSPFKHNEDGFRFASFRILLSYDCTSQSNWRQEVCSTSSLSWFLRSQPFKMLTWKIFLSCRRTLSLVYFKPFATKDKELTYLSALITLHWLRSSVPIFPTK